MAGIEADEIIALPGRLEVRDWMSEVRDQIAEVKIKVSQRPSSGDFHF
jgi:hypothetical protein